MKETIDWVFVIAAIIILVIGLLYAWGNFSAIGLVLDMSGFLLVFGFGLPSRFATNWDVPKGISWEKVLSWIGVGLVTLGFFFQFVANMKVDH
jgi:hypothetical protein